MNRVPGSSPCPTPAQLAGLADGGLPPEARARITEHVSSCDRCLTDLGAVVRMGREQPLVLPDTLKARVVRRSRPRWQAVAAAAVVLLGVGTWVATQRQVHVSSDTVSADAVRTRQSDSREPILLMPAQDQRLAASGLAFEWQPVTGAVAYRVRVILDDGRLVWETETTKTRLDVEAVRGWPLDHPLYVTVTAVLPDARTARAPSIRFTLSP